jgi:uncharacterized membrane protein
MKYPTVKRFYKINKKKSSKYFFLVIQYRMLKWVKELLVSTIVLLILDFAYIGINLRAFQDQVTTVQRVVMQFRPAPAVITYILMIFALNYFIIKNNRSIMEAFALGLVIIGVYETTNYSMFKKWNPYLVVMDTLWGGVLFATTTAVTYNVL